MNEKSAIVTGASAGIGRAIALKLASMGYDLILAARNVGKLEETARLCSEFNARCVVCETDVTKESDVSRMIGKAESEFGGLDVLINNAGMGIFKPFYETTTEDFKKVIDTNLTGAFMCAREAFKVMAERKKGIIVNIASVVGIKGYPNQSAYTASKHGLVGLTKVIAEEGKSFGIRSHVICPGGVATDMVVQSRPDIDADELIHPEDVADLVRYLIELPPRVMIDIVHMRRATSSSF